MPRRWPPKKKRAKWNRSTRKTHDTLDISKYLAEEAEIAMITQRIIDNFVRNHQNRVYNPKKRRYRSRFINYKHGAHPFCRVCYEDFYVGDDIYVFLLGRSGSYPMFYHIECFNKTRETRQRSVIYQDRAQRKRNPGINLDEIIEADEREPTEIEKFREAERKSGYKGKIG